MQVERQPEVTARAGIADPRRREVARWKLATRIGFRFAFIFFPIYNFWVLVHFIPIPFLIPANHAFWDMLVRWTAAHVLHVQLVFSPLNHPGGSRDTTANWVGLFCYLVVSAVVTLIWSVLDRQRPNYERLFVWFRLYLRLALAELMLSYGAYKVFPAQFPPPSLSTLLEPYGESSPMHLLWTFMGASRSYSFFTGAVEVLGGALLIVPPLTMLGAMICLGAMANVLMLNLGYDVPVKIFAFNLVAMSAVLLLPDLQRLANFFVFNRRVEPAVVRPLFRRKSLNMAALALQIAFGVALLSYDLYSRGERAIQLARVRVETPLYGIWSVEEFRVDGQARPPLLTDSQRWQRMIIESSDGVLVQPMSGSQQFFNLKVDPHHKSFSMMRPENWMRRSNFTYENPQPDRLMLTGQLEGHDVAVKFHRLDESDFLLMNRGFHWINEYAFDR